MAGFVITSQSGWTGPFELRVIFCTARVKGRGNTSTQQDQDVYLRAL